MATVLNFHCFRSYQFITWKFMYIVQSSYLLWGIHIHGMLANSIAHSQYYSGCCSLAYYNAIAATLLLLALSWLYPQSKSNPDSFVSWRSRNVKAYSGCFLYSRHSKRWLYFYLPIHTSCQGWWIISTHVVYLEN